MDYQFCYNSLSQYDQMILKMKIKIFRSDHIFEVKELMYMLKEDLKGITYFQYY